jgi:ferrous iron transport protein A
MTNRKFGEKMMPLILARGGETSLIKKVGGKDEVRQFLAKLGFVPGAYVTVVTKTGGNVIVNIKESRIAVNKDMAAKIFV